MAALACGALSAGPSSAQLASTPSGAAGLDHINIAVRDLAAAAERYRALGFALKPGQPHANGIQNQHAKFADGTELELITAPEARDALTTTYRRLLAEGEGPAFLALFVSPAVAKTLSPPDYVFFGALNHSPTDKPEHFAHANGAESLVAVWLAGAGESERSLLRSVGAQFEQRLVHVPEARRTQVAILPDGDEVLLLPEMARRLKNRPIVGLTVRVRDLAATHRVLSKVPGFKAGPPDPTATRIILPPELALGMWLEFRQIRCCGLSQSASGASGF